MGKQESYPINASCTVLDFSDMGKFAIKESCCASSLLCDDL
jgi:hypothetical protein